MYPKCKAEQRCDLSELSLYKISLGGVPAMAQWVKNQTAVGVQVRFPSAVGERIQRCHSCGLGHSLSYGSDSTSGLRSSICLGWGHKKKSPSGGNVHWKGRGHGLKEEGVTGDGGLTCGILQQHRLTVKKKKRSSTGSHVESSSSSRLPAPCSVPSPHWVKLPSWEFPSWHSG